MRQQPVPRRPRHRRFMLSPQRQRHNARSGRAPARILPGPGGAQCIIEHALPWIPAPAHIAHRQVNISLRHLEFRIPGGAQKHQLPRGGRKVRVGLPRLRAQIAPPALVLFRFGAKLKGMGELQRPAYRRLHLFHPFAGDMAIDLSQHQPRDGVVVGRRVGRPVDDVRRLGRRVRKQAVGPLTGNDKIYRPLNLRAIGTVTGLMPARQEGHDAKARHRRLTRGRGRKRAVRRLLRGQPGQRAVHRIFHLPPSGRGQRRRQRRGGRRASRSRAAAAAPPITSSRVDANA